MYKGGGTTPYKILNVASLRTTCNGRNYTDIAWVQRGTTGECITAVLFSNKNHVLGYTAYILPVIDDLLLISNIFNELKRSNH